MSDEVCNIGDRGVRRRRKTGTMWLVIAVAASAWLVARPGPALAYVPLAIPFGWGALGFLQAREKT